MYYFNIAILDRKNGSHAHQLPLTCDVQLVEFKDFEDYQFVIYFYAEKFCIMEWTTGLRIASSIFSKEDVVLKANIFLSIFGVEKFTEAYEKFASDFCVLQIYPLNDPSVWTL
jgi:hypothetical protein